MNGLRPPAPRVLPALGCTALAATIVLLVLLPFLLADVMGSALVRLHLHPQVALLAVAAIFLGSVVNIPLYRIERHEDQFVDLGAIFGFWGWRAVPRWRRVRRETTVAVNLGGGVIPAALALWQVIQIVPLGGGTLMALVLAVALNTAVCYRAARPVEGVGIVMPALLSPLVAVAATWFLLGSPEEAPQRAPVAFAAGVLAPLIGADLLHLKDVTRVSTGVVSIGGAGTFDGIVLSGVLAALLA